MPHGAFNPAAAHAAPPVSLSPHAQNPSPVRHLPRAAAPAARRASIAAERYRSAWNRALGAALLSASLLAAAGCRDVARGFGGSAPAAAAHADQLFGALADRYTNVARSPKYDRARIRLAESALVPSKVFGDTATWTASPGPSSRRLVVGGALADGRYHLDARPTAPAPHAPGDARHVILLDRTGDQQYAWDTDVDFALGSLAPADVDALFATLYRAPEGRGEAALRADYRAAFPRSTTVLGQLATLDSVAPVASADGSTTTMLAAHMEPKRLAARFPHFAKWLGKYVGGSKYRFRLMDASGAIWMAIEGGDSRLTMRFRSIDGRLLPLYGTHREMPDTMRLVVDWTTKVKIFTVGVKNLATELRITRTPAERAVTIVATREPDWKLPLVTEHLIRSSLRYPFQGAGVTFSLAVRQGRPGEPTLLNRKAHLAVQESGILRFLAGLTSHAVSEFDAAAEAEQDAFLHELFVALQADTRALLGPVAADP